MRGQLTVGNAIVREIRPIDVIRACDRLLFTTKDGDTITNEQWSAALFSNSDLMTGDVTEEVNAAFLFINRAYSDGDFPDSSQKYALTRRKLQKLKAALLKECAVLTTYNHQACWEYGFAYFKTVQELYQKK
jgi:hypothetical protein